MTNPAQKNTSFLKEIIGYARFAPSGDNVQPWYVTFDTDTITVFYDGTENDIEHDIYQIDRGAEYISLGAFIESIVLATEGLGGVATVTLLNEDARVATILCKQHGRSKDLSTLKALRTRRTDRRAFQSIPLSDDDLATLSESAQKSGGALRIFDDTQSFRTYGSIMALHEKIFWTTPHMRENMLHTFRSGKKKDQITGMPLSHLGLGYEAAFIPLALKLAHLFPFLWHLVIRLNIRRYNSMFKKSSGIGFLTFPHLRLSEVLSDTSKRRLTLLEAGRSMQRFWITCEKRGVVLQPFFGPLMIMFRDMLQQETVPEPNATRTTELISAIKQSFPFFTNEFPIFVFRIGRPKYTPLSEVPKKTLDLLIHD